MKTKLTIAALMLCSSTQSFGQTSLATVTQAAVDCREFSGTACILTPGSAPISSSDYGAIYVRLAPPSDVNEQAVAARKNDWKNILRRFFIKKAKTGVVVAEVYQNEKLITILPVALFTVDEKKGLNLDAQAQFTSFQQASPFLRLDAVSNPVQVRISVRSTTEPVDFR